MKLTRTTTKEMIRAWTDRPVQAIFLAVVTILFFASATLDVPGLRMFTVLLMAFVVLTATLGGGGLGLVSGLIGAAVFIGIHGVAGQWEGRQEAVRLAMVLAFVGYGGLSGLVAGHLKHRHSRLRRPPAATGAGGSLGLLTAEQGRELFLAELERIRRTNEPVGMLIVQATETESVGGHALQHALRAVARSVESFAGQDVLPVLLDRNRFALILPNHDAGEVTQIRNVLVKTIEQATFADRSAGSRRAVADVLQLQSRLLVTKGQQVAVDIFPEFSIDRSSQAVAGTIEAAA